MDMKEIANEMKELEIKAGKYDDIKEEMDKTLGLITEKFGEIQELSTRLSLLHWLSEEREGLMVLGEKQLITLKNAISILLTMQMKKCQSEIH